MKKAIFAGGCFWCMEYVFDKISGVLETISGYTGGKTKNPTYEEVSSGKTGHFEAILIKYDETKISYERLLEFFWKNIDASDDKGQFLDKGTQYKTAIFYQNKEEKELAELSKERILDSKIFGDKVFVSILPANNFFSAENYHQNYYKTCPAQFNAFHQSSGRERFALRLEAKAERFRLFPEKKRYWLGYKKPTLSELKKWLNPLQIRVTQENQTEKPFFNEYFDNFEEGIYVDIISGEPLFSSKDKVDFDSGWPTFTKPLEEKHLLEFKDNSLLEERIEIRSKYANSHLGHLFFDLDKFAGKRYCINSASLFFIPKNQLKEEGYSFYLNLFD